MLTASKEKKAELECQERCFRQRLCPGQRLDLGTKCQIRRTGQLGRVWQKNALGRGLGRCNGLEEGGLQPASELVTWVQSPWAGKAIVEDTARPGGPPAFSACP